MVCRRFAQCHTVRGTYCAREYHGIAKIREEIFALDPYHPTYLLRTPNLPFKPRKFSLLFLVYLRQIYSSPGAGLAHRRAGKCGCGRRKGSGLGWT